MKKLFPILLVIASLVSACQLGGSAQPTAIAVQQAATPTPIPINPTDAPADKNPGAGSERTSSLDGMVLAYIPEGTFQMGGIDANAQSDELPVRKVSMKGFWLDKVEVTNAMYALCVNAGACNLPFAIKSETRPSYFNNAEFNDYPVVNVSWGQARDYCAWAGRRLPTEAEWERAARGDDLRTFPWGDQRADSSLANINYFVGDTTRVGSFPVGASPFGIFDMAGNVAEWVNDFYGPTYYGSAINSNPPGPLPRANYFNRVIRGGSFQDEERNVRVANRGFSLGPNPDARLDTPAYWGEYSAKIGFRCASDN